MTSNVGLRVRLTFPESHVRSPVIATLVRDFDVIADIRRAEISDDGGWILCELDGAAGQIDAAISWLGTQGISVDLLGDVLES